MTDAWRELYERAPTFIDKIMKGASPAEIPIGVITKVDPNELDTSQQVHMRPYANMHNLDVVQVLTQPTTRSSGP